MRQLAAMAVLTAAHAAQACPYLVRSCFCAPDIVEVTVTTSSPLGSTGHVDFRWPGGTGDATEVAVQGTPPVGTKLLIGTTAQQVDGGDFACTGHVITRAQALDIAAGRADGTCEQRYDDLVPPPGCKDRGCGCSATAAAPLLVLLLALRNHRRPRREEPARSGRRWP